MKWAADPSCYKTGAGSLNECSIRRIKYLAPASPGIGCGSVRGFRWGWSRRRIISRRGRRQGSQRRDDEGDCTRGREPPVRKHGMDGPRNLAPARVNRGCSIRCATSSTGFTTASAPSRPTSTGYGASSSSTEATPRGDRGRGSGGVSGLFRGPRPGRLVHPEAGAERHRVSLPAGIEKENSAGWSMGDARGQSKNSLRIFALTPNSRGLPCLTGMADWQ